MAAQRRNASPQLAADGTSGVPRLPALRAVPRKPRPVSGGCNSQGVLICRSWGWSYQRRSCIGKCERHTNHSQPRVKHSPLNPRRTRCIW